MEIYEFLEWLGDGTLALLKFIAVFSVDNPLISIIALLGILALIMLVSHVIDMKEGLWRHGLLWSVFLIILVLGLVIILLSLQKGTLNFSGFGLFSVFF